MVRAAEAIARGPQAIGRRIARALLSANRLSGSCDAVDHDVSLATKPRTGEYGLEASASEPLAMTKGKGAASVSTDDKVARE